MKAQAILDLMLIRKDRYTREQIETQRKIVADLNAYSIPPTPPPAPALPVSKETSEANLSPKVLQIVNNLKAERDAIDKQKNALSNKMIQVPDSVNCKELVKEIKGLREKWILKGDEIYYVLRHGELPNATTSTTEIVIELPEDKLLLNRMLLNARTNLSKYRKRLALAKEESQKQLQAKNIKKAEVYIRNIEFKLNAL